VTFRTSSRPQTRAIATIIMVSISSKTLIQAHAVFLVVIAGYLVKNPEVITDSDLVFMMGEALKIVCPRNIPDSQVHFYHIGNESTYIY
jgi:hypothetical protein